MELRSRKPQSSNDDAPQTIILQISLQEDEVVHLPVDILEFMRGS
jgi:hypothetical protein